MQFYKATCVATLYTLKIDIFRNRNHGSCFANSLTYPLTILTSNRNKSNSSSTITTTTTNNNK